MSLVTTVVYLSQAMRHLATRMQAKAVKAIGVRIEKVIGEQVKIEARRSELRVDCHNRFYKEEAELTAKFEKKMAKLKADFIANKGVIAVTSQAASDELKRELAMLGRELDHLTK